MDYQWLCSRMMDQFYQLLDCFHCRKCHNLHHRKDLQLYLDLLSPVVNHFWAVYSLQNGQKVIMTTLRIPTGTKTMRYVKLQGVMELNWHFYLIIR